MGILAKIFGTRNSRMLAQLQPIVKEVKAFGETLTTINDAELQAYTQTFKEQLKAGKTLDDILPRYLQ